MRDSQKVDTWILGYREGEEKSCDYAMNIGVMNIGGIPPDDMVLLFESEPGWNQVGGIELLRKNMQNRCWVLFADNHEEFIRWSDAPYLRWKLQSNPVKPEVNITSILILESYILGFLFFWILSKLGSSYAKRYWIYFSLFGILSMGVGMVLGEVAEDFMYVLGDTKNIGWIIGGIPGLMIAVSYIFLLAAKFENKESDVSIVGYATLSGLIAGAICSCLTHIVLMICYDDMNIINILAGLAFGTIAGIALGWISSGVLPLYNRKFISPNKTIIAESGMTQINEGSYGRK